MSKTELDWSFAEAPGPDEAGPPRAAPPARRGRVPRRAWLAVLVLTVLAGVAAYGVVQVGWRRLEAQLTREIAYEDEQARAGEIERVQSLLAGGDEAWLRQRAAEVALGLAAPLPAAHLLPVDTPPRLAELTSLGGGHFQATVVRAYADAAGQKFEFAQAQRYRNLGPGLWERLPPDTAALEIRRLWSGQRLSVSLPAADWPWLKDALAAADAALVQACAAWGTACPDDLIIPVTFTGRWLDLPPPALPARAAGAAAGLPLTFDLIDTLPPESGRLVLPAPHLTGLPRDAAAQAAFTRAFTVQALLYLGRRVAGTAPAAHNAYRDALLARAEIRLGLSRPPQPVLESDVAPGLLWQPPEDTPTPARHRQQALAFLDHVLAAQPAETDGQLLSTLRDSTGFDHWLGRTLGAAAAPALAGWAEVLNARFDAGQTLSVPQLDGLAYACQDEARLLRQGQPVPLPLAEAGLRLEPTALSRDGRYLAYLTRPPSADHIQLNLLDLSTRRVRSLNVGRAMVLVGWTAEDDLVYLKRQPFDDRPGEGFFLMRYTLGRGYHLQLAAQPVQREWPSVGQWGGDGTAVALTLDVPAGGGLLQTAPALVSVLAPDHVRLLAGEGHSPALAPDGRTAAYVVSDAFVGGSLNFGTNIDLRDLTTGAQRRLVTTGDLTADGTPASLLYLAWSPDGETLAFLAVGQTYGVRLFTVPAAGGPVQPLAQLAGDAPVLPLRFSADGRYLSYYTGFSNDAFELTVHALATGARMTYTTTFGGTAWSPRGHWLAVAGPGGVFVTDPATTATRWLTLKDCARVAWYKERNW